MGPDVEGVVCGWQAAAAAVCISAALHRHRAAGSGMRSGGPVAFTCCDAGSKPASRPASHIPAASLLPCAPAHAQHRGPKATGNIRAHPPYPSSVSAKQPMSSRLVMPRSSRSWWRCVPSLSTVPPNRLNCRGRGAAMAAVSANSAHADVHASVQVHRPACLELRSLRQVRSGAAISACTHTQQHDPAAIIKTRMLLTPCIALR